MRAGLLQSRIKENWETYDRRGRYKGMHPLWRRMTPAERSWAENFERLQYAIEKDRVNIDGRPALEALGIDEPSADLIERLNEEAQAKCRENHNKATKDANRKRAKNKTDRIVSEGVYTWEDIARFRGWGRAKDEPKRNGEGRRVELGITTNHEERLTDGLSAISDLGISFEEFLAKPELWPLAKDEDENEKPKLGRPPKEDPPDERQPPKLSLLTAVGLVSLKRGWVWPTFQLLLEGPDSIEWIYDRGRLLILDDYLARELQDTRTAFAVVQYADRMEVWSITKNQRRWLHDYPRAKRTALQILTVEAKPQGF